MRNLLGKHNEDHADEHHDEEFGWPNGGVHVPVANCWEGNDDEPQGVKQWHLFFASSLQVLKTAHADWSIVD